MGKQNVFKKVPGECLTSNGAASIVSWDPGEGYRGGGCLGDCETRLVWWNCRKGKNKNRTKYEERNQNSAYDDVLNK